MYYDCEGSDTTWELRMMGEWPGRQTYKPSLRFPLQSCVEVSGNFVSIRSRDMDSLLGGMNNAKLWIAWAAEKASKDDIWEARDGTVLLLRMYLADHDLINIV